MRHLEPNHSTRGFAHMPEIVGRIGEVFAAYESSNAAGPHVWVKLAAPTDRNHPEAGRQHLYAELTSEDARKLGEQLIWLADNHYQTT